MENYKFKRDLSEKPWKGLFQEDKYSVTQKVDNKEEEIASFPSQSEADAYKANLEKEAKKQKLEVKKEAKLKEGTWALSKNNDDYKNFINQLQALKKHYIEIIGDDDLYDHIDGAMSRLRELKTIMQSQENEGMAEELSTPPNYGI